MAFRALTPRPTPSWSRYGSSAGQIRENTILLLCSIVECVWSRNSSPGLVGQIRETTDDTDFSFVAWFRFCVYCLQSAMCLYNLKVMGLLRYCETQKIVLIFSTYHNSIVVCSAIKLAGTNLLDGVKGYSTARGMPACNKGV